MEVTLEQGKLHGSTATDVRGNSFFKFQGIPYARPPLGELRFKAAEPPVQWSGVYDATKEKDICYSRDPLKKGKVAGSEDCLYLNVFTKKIPDSDKNLSPVLVWIHGGGLIWGSGNEEFYGPDFLLTENVVLVTINYRLGLLGFLSFAEPSLEIPGNAGLKDQVMALKWVQTNISKFGGDPNNVTIFGESAGAASVHLLMLSPMAKGLFHKVIAQSGCALSPWSYGETATEALAHHLNLEPNEETLYRELMEKSCAKILDLQEKMFENTTADRRKAIGVVVEKNSKDPFLEREPMDKILAGDFSQVPFMIGYTSCEGMFSEILKKPGQSEVVNCEEFIPWTFGYHPGSPESKTVGKKIQDFYFGGANDAQDLAIGAYNLFGDCHILSGIHDTLLTQYNKSKAPTYFYRMSVESELNFFKNFYKIQFPGVSHLDDVGYLFKNFITPEIKPGSLEDISMSRIVRLWTNFAKYGNPTPDKNDPLLETEWKPVTGRNLDFLEIGQELTSGTNPDAHRMGFWKSLFSESPAGQKFLKLD